MVVKQISSLIKTPKRDLQYFIEGGLCDSPLLRQVRGKFKEIQTAPSVAVGLSCNALQTAAIGAKKITKHCQSAV